MCTHATSQRKSSQKRDFELGLHASHHLKNNPPKGRIPKRWVGYACKIDGNMDANLYVSILEDELQNSLQYWGKTPEGWSSSRIMTLNTPVKSLKPGWQTMDLMSWCGLLNPLISILLSIYGATSRGSLQSIRSHLQAFRSYGPGCRRSGMILGSRSVGI